MTALETQLYRALKLMPDRCQMVGGPKWHLQATATVAKQCSRCAAIEAYDTANLLSLNPPPLGVSP